MAEYLPWNTSQTEYSEQKKKVKESEEVEVYVYGVSIALVGPNSIGGVEVEENQESEVIYYL